MGWESLVDMTREERTLSQPGSKLWSLTEAQVALQRRVTGDPDEIVAVRTERVRDPTRHNETVIQVTFHLPAFDWLPKRIRDWLRVDMILRVCVALLSSCTGVLIWLV